MYICIYVYTVQFASKFTVECVLSHMLHSKFMIKLVSYWRVHEPCRSAFNTHKPRTSVFNACKYSQMDLSLHVHAKFNIHS